MAKILVVDDDIDFVEQLKIQLEAAGYEVVTANSVAEAEELIEKEQPDGAIVDLMLEYADGGFSLCYKLKKFNEKMPVILATSVANETGIDFDASTDEERSWIKADIVLAKPIRFEQLRRELERLLKKSRTG